MIERVIIKNYRIYKTLEFKPDPRMNIIVGDNEAGKSTLIEAISMAIEGRYQGRSLVESISPYWFNEQATKEYFARRKNGERPDIPRILIEVYFSKTDEPQILRGKVNSLHLDQPGFAVEIGLDEEYASEFESYITDNPPPILPIEYFKVSWHGFHGKELYRKPKELDVLHIDSRTTLPSRQVDYRARRLLSDLVDSHEASKISVNLRQQRHQLTSKTLSAVNEQVREKTRELGYSLTLELDQSSLSSWESAIVPHLDSLPFSYAGQGQQVLMKTALAMTPENRDPKFVFVEEPENHLSHTSLFRTLEDISRLANGRQVFLTTHSSFVLNRLGLSHLKLIHRGLISDFVGSLSADTVSYFQKQSGYDTLRIVLAKKLVIVEGPSDEMIFKRAYLDVTKRTTEEDGVDVIALGTRHSRALEVCKELDKSIAALRDNDGKDPQHWQKRFAGFLTPGMREMFIGSITDGYTLEPQMISANKQAIEKLREVTGCGEDRELEEYMTKNKTEWAWRVASSKESFNYPDYVIRAIRFVEQM